MDRRNLADTTPNTSPKFCNDVTRRSNLTTRKSSLSDATVAASEDLNLDRHQQHQAAAGIRTASTVKRGSEGTSSRKLAADVDHGTMGRKDRDLTIVQTLKDRQNLHKFLERKAELAAQGKKWLNKDIRN